MERQWIFLSNPFETSTRGTNVKMLSFSTNTDSKLAAEVSDLDILAIYNDYHPLHVAYQQICGNYEGMAGSHKGRTLNLEIVMNETLLVELRRWESAVGVVYVEDSPKWVAFFPQRRKPFISGRYASRINAVYSLCTALSADPLLAALGVQVQSFYNVLLSARSTQQQKKGLLGYLSGLREQQRIIIAQALYGLVLGALMKKYKSDTQQIARFFNLSLIRQKGDAIPARSIVIKGRVTYGMGSNAAGATVAVERTNTPAKTATTDDDGKYELSFDDVPFNEAGNATLTITAQGFQIHTQSIFVELGKSYTFNITLKQKMQMVA